MSLQVFHSLLKAHTMEARSIVRQAMAILTPAVPARMEDGHQMLTHWTRKIIVEEGHTVPQLVHILHLIVQHFRVRSSSSSSSTFWSFSPSLFYASPLSLREGSGFMVSH